MARPDRARLKDATTWPSGKPAATGRLDYFFVALCIIGLGIASYLAWTHFTETPIICTADRSCDTVNRSAYAYFPPNWGIPVSLLGWAGYAALLGMGLARWRIAGRPGKGSTARLDGALFIATLGGVIFSGYLTAMELWVIHAICWWCVGSAICVSLLFIIALLRVWSGD